MILINLNSKTYVAFHGHSTSQALNSTTAAPGGTDIGTVSGAAATALQVLRTMFVNVGMDRYIGFNMNQWIVPIRGQICVSNKYIYTYFIYIHFRGIAYVFTSLYLQLTTLKFFVTYMHVRAEAATYTHNQNNDYAVTVAATTTVTTTTTATISARAKTNYPSIQPQ